MQWYLKNIYPGSTVVSDGLQYSDSVVETKCIHEVHIVGEGNKTAEHPTFKWGNTVAGNAKNSLSGMYGTFAQKHVPRYLVQFQFYFNHRFNVPGLNVSAGFGFTILATRPIASFSCKSASQIQDGR